MKTMLAWLLLSAIVRADEWSDKRDAARAAAINRGALTEAKARDKGSSAGRLLTVPPSTKALEEAMMKVPGHIQMNDELYAECLAEAKRLYPESTVAGSRFTTRASEVGAWLYLRQHPMLNDSRYPLLVAHVVSIELTGAMRSETVTGIQAAKEKPKPTKDEQYQALTNAATETVPHIGVVTGIPKLPIDTGEIEIEVRGNWAHFSNGESVHIRERKADGGRIVDLAPALSGSTAGVPREIVIPNSDHGRITMPNGMDRDYRRQGDRITIFR